MVMVMLGGIPHLVTALRNEHSSKATASAAAVQQLSDDIRSLGSNLAAKVPLGSFRGGYQWGMLQTSCLSSLSVHECFLVRV